MRWLDWLRGADAPVGGSWRINSFGIVVFAYLLALAAALWIVSLPVFGDALWRLLAADIVATLVIFAFAMRLDNSSMYDPYWSVVPPMLALFWIGEAHVGTSATRQWIVTALVFAWAIRLTANWARGWPGLHHEDWRYVDLYENGPLPKWATSLLGIHLFPTVIVFVGCLGLLPALAYPERAWNWLDSIALIVTGSAIVIEAVADEQMRAFARTKKPGDIMQSGLWAWSRHPNYFGELGFWWGLFLFGAAADPGYAWTIIGPLAMTAMFHFASIPLLDQRSLARRPGYGEYMARVNGIVPAPPTGCR